MLLISILYNPWLYFLYRYTNIMMTNSSGAHSVEVGDFNMTNLLPNSPYKVSERRNKFLHQLLQKLLCIHLLFVHLYQVCLKSKISGEWKYFVVRPVAFRHFINVFSSSESDHTSRRTTGRERCCCQSLLSSEVARCDFQKNKIHVDIFPQHVETNITSFKLLQHHCHIN